MTKPRYSLVILSFIYSYALADTLNYAVVAPGATTVQVNVGGSSVTLSQPTAGLSYFTGAASASTTDPYHYIADGTSEGFTRTFPSARTSTYNDFLGRQTTIDDMVQLNYPFGQWNRSLGPNGVYDDDYIPTIFFLAGSASFFTGGKKSPSADGVTVAFITKDDVGYWTDVSMTGKHGEQTKIEVIMTLPQPFHQRSIYKLRPSVFDPVFIREKIYNDILQAIGCPHEETTPARVYVGSAGLGVYHLQEQTGSLDFVRTQFYGRNVAQPATLGSPLDASTGADFAPSTNIGDFQPVSGQSNANIETLIDALNVLDVTSDSAISTFNTNWFDIETFLRAIIVEYLAGDWDSYLFFTTNFVVYDDPTEGASNTHRYYFIDQDFDQTFGVDLSTPYNTYGSAFTTQPFSVYVNKTWSLTTDDAPHRTMVDKLLSNPDLSAHFYTLMQQIVMDVYNPIQLGQRISAVADRIRPEIYWDRNLGSSRARTAVQTSDTITPWTPSDYDNGFNTSVGGNWGFLNFITERANFIASTYGFQFDGSTLTPSAPPSSPPPSSPTTTSSVGTSASTTSANGQILTSSFVATSGVIGTSADSAMTTSSSSTTSINPTSAGTGTTGSGSASASASTTSGGSTASSATTKGSSSAGSTTASVSTPSSTTASSSTASSAVGSSTAATGTPSNQIGSSSTNVIFVSLIIAAMFA